MNTKPSYPATFCALALILFVSCSSHKYYTSANFDQETRTHRLIAILPAEMIFTGIQPKNMTPEMIEEIEETESIAFQNSLFNGILRNANSKKYMTYINMQDISTTQKLLEENNISIRDSWKEDDKKLSKLLGVDAVVRMRIQKKRYMSDLASMGVNIGRQVISQIGGGKVPVPYVSSKTNDIYASCNLVCDSKTLWNDNYEAGTNYNRPSEQVIDDITDNFGRHFPYRKRK